MTEQATNRQLWRLNAAGRLRLSEEDGRPISSKEAWEAVRGLLRPSGGDEARQGESHA